MANVPMRRHVCTDNCDSTGVWTAYTPLPSAAGIGFLLVPLGFNLGPHKAPHGHLDIQARDYSHICIVH